MYIMDDSLHGVGKFHLGQAYDLLRFSEESKSRKMDVFDCQEEFDEEDVQVRSLVVTPGAILIF